ncbi:unnamed protein product [Nippostrongylus brasiliensis]|uniref:VWFA domain-containing protein n=1 Tax=Nippostrongylus brasiliensis TaxID=27835 RepID=A0A0N4YRL0_NIPBR|nr:unnamed protein product [Nippostrongylus brasiliensis]
MALALKLSMLLNSGPGGWWSDYGSMCNRCGNDLYNMDLCSSQQTCVKGTVFPTYPWTFAGSRSCVAKLYCPGSPTVTVKYASGRIEKGVALTKFNSDYRLECFMDGTRSMTGPNTEVIAGFACENAPATTTTKKPGKDFRIKFVIKMLMTEFVKKMFHYVRDSYVGVVQFSGRSRVTLPVGLYSEKQLLATPLVQISGGTNIISAMMDADNQLRKTPRGNIKTVVLLTDGYGTCSKSGSTCQIMASKWRKENTQLVFVPIGFTGKGLAAMFGSQKPHITRPAVNFNALTEMFFASLMQDMCVARK